MGDQLFFKIPDEQEVRVKLVRAIPLNWLSVTGRLEAPKALLASGTVQEDTGFILEQFHSIHPTIIGEYDQQQRIHKHPNLVALLVERKLPGFVDFDEAGLDTNGVVTLNVAKKVAVGFLKKGYGGALHFRSKYRSDHHWPYARCSFRFEPWHGAPYLGEESGWQPARVNLQWDESYGGEVEDIRPLIHCCRQLGLQEYIPAPGTETGAA